MVIGHHLIWTVYGWWLPNDPRGSSSKVIRVERIKDLGEAQYGRQPTTNDELRRFAQTAEERLKHPVYLLSDGEQTIVGNAIGDVISAAAYTCYAAAILPEHVHLLVRRHRESAETMLERFQTPSRTAIRAFKNRDECHPVWGGPGWKVFQSSAEQMRRTISYIEANPEKAGRPRQRWAFVTRYDGWEPPPVRRDGRF